LNVARSEVVNHPLFKAVQTEAGIQLFMANHVFAVWDFMCLLKTLQIRLTCTTVPWQSPKNIEAARFINEIVLGEETDDTGHGIYSHFDLYRAAMIQAGADTTSIDSFTARIKAGFDLRTAFGGLEVAPQVENFVRTTLDVCRRGAHEVAASFFFGREDVIPDMFTRALTMNGLTSSPRFALLELYMRRHIELDGDSHGPRARKILESLCEGDEVKSQQAMAAARQALEARRLLWDGVLHALEQSSRMPELSGLETEPIRRPERVATL